MTQTQRSSFKNILRSILEVLEIFVVTRKQQRKEINQLLRTIEFHRKVDYLEKNESSSIANMSGMRFF